MNTIQKLMIDILTTAVYASIIPGLLLVLYLNNIIILGTLQLCAAIFFFIFFVIPLIFKFCYPLQRHVLFLNFVNLPINPYYSNPEKYDLNGTRNFYINTDDNIALGTWHILPENLIPTTNSQDELYYKKSLRSGESVFIYMHGNSGNRAASHRIDLYKILRKHYHIIAFDYRSYGDSTDEMPSEIGLVNDAMTVVKWVRNYTDARIFVWGHSLGTGIATHSLHQLALENLLVDGLVLESPFTSIHDEIKEHPWARIFKHLPWFKYTILDAMFENGLRFETNKHILHVNCSILILHAEDDRIIPFKLGYELYQTALKNRLEQKGIIEFKGFPAEAHHGHKYICRASDLSSIISNFEERSTDV